MHFKEKEIPTFNKFKWVLMKWSQNWGVQFNESVITNFIEAIFCKREIKVRDVNLKILFSETEKLVNFLLSNTNMYLSINLFLKKEELINLH